jgi:NMD protein affecting ribosome stability and mRNA decay
LLRRQQIDNSVFHDWILNMCMNCFFANDTQSLQLQHTLELYECQKGRLANICAVTSGHSVL